MVHGSRCVRGMSVADRVTGPWKPSVQSKPSGRIGLLVAVNLALALLLALSWSDGPPDAAAQTSGGSAGYLMLAGEPTEAGGAAVVYIAEPGSGRVAALSVNTGRDVVDVLGRADGVRDARQSVRGRR